MQQQSELPEGWVSAKFEEFTQNLDGKRIPLKSSDRNNRQGQYPYYGASGIIDYIDDYIFDGKFLLISEDGANLVARNTPIAFIANGQFWVNNHAHIVKTYCNIPLEYLSFFFSGVDLFPFITGSAQPKLTKSNLSNIEISLPPLAEQHRIVSAIEALFARLDAANEQLDRVPEILKRFRQSVLAAACEGRLTEEWREDNEEFNVKTTDDLKENTGFLKTWKTTTIGEISDLTSGLHFKKSEYSDEGVRLLQITNVSFGIIKWEKTAFLPETYIVNYPELVLKPGDLLMALNRPLLGDNLKVSKLTERDCPSILYQRVGRFDIYDENYIDYFYCFLQSPLFIERLKNDLQGVDQPFINKSKLLKMPIPLPPLPEQHEIVRRVDALFALADSIEAKVAAAQERTEKLRQAVLTKAFSGELVETEAELARREGRDYEPADVLLERIKSEQGMSGKKGKAAKGKSTHRRE